ncbi:hypothetical protein ACWERW_32260 [Streptomyces sp. NPDC004012]
MNQPTSRLDMLRFARRVVEQQSTRQLALIDRWIADEAGSSASASRARSAGRRSRSG